MCGRALIIASNRGPITFNGGADPRFRRGAGGLVTALTGLAQQMDATWIACARSSADTGWLTLSWTRPKQRGTGSIN